MAKKSEVAETPVAKWYETLEPSYIGDRLYQTGERVQFGGEAGANLRELTDDELKAPEPVKTDADLIIDQQAEIDKAKADLDQREADLAVREKEADAKEQAAATQAEANDKRAAELDAREATVAAKETAAIPAAE